MARRPRASLLGALLIAAGPAQADPAFRIGARGGVDIQEVADPYLGVDLRASFARSPLTMNLTFDRTFDAHATLYRAGVDAFYYLPVPARWVDPYLGMGVDVTHFSRDEATAGADRSGGRVGMNLAAGACLEVPFVAPFIQIVKHLGELDPLSLGGGLLVPLDGDDRWSACGRRAR